MKKKQRTPKGAEIPIPTRGEFLRNLKKATTPKPQPSTRKRRPKK